MGANNGKQYGSEGEPGGRRVLERRESARWERGTGRGAMRRDPGPPGSPARVRDTVLGLPLRPLKTPLIFSVFFFPLDRSLSAVSAHGVGAAARLAVRRQLGGYGSVNFAKKL